jgi:hypothetical protein
MIFKVDNCNLAAIIGTMRADTRSENATIPIVLGIVGHRQIRGEDEARLGKTLKGIFTKYLDSYLHTPLVVLSALAEGADQLAAKVALALAEEDQYRGRISVLAPLPFASVVYAESSSFSLDKEAAKRMLDWTESRVVESFVVPIPSGPASDDIFRWAALRDETEKRRTCYANAGGYIVRHCHALIALWDTADEGGASGTGEIVAFKLSSAVPRLYPWRKPLLHGSDSGPVYVIYAPRIGSIPNRDPREPGFLEVRLPSPKHHPSLRPPH